MLNPKTTLALTLPLAFAVACGSPLAADEGKGAAETEANAPSGDGSDPTPAGTDTTQAGATPAASEETDAMAEVAPNSVYALDAKTLSGDDVSLGKYSGDVTVFVNVASKCGYTPQYEGLQALHEELAGNGVTVVGVPSNDFGKQEPGSAEDIAAFCQENYGVTFDMLEKVSTKDGSPLFDRLADMTGERPGWNFCKYVVSKDGTEAKFFASGVTPSSDELRGAIAAYQAQ